MRKIDHPQVVECASYPLGAVQQPTEVWKNQSTGNIYAYLGERVFDVHPKLQEVNGYPIRWELDERQRAKLQEDRDFWKGLGLE